MTRKIFIAVASLTVVTAIIIFGFIWNEARKEIFYLCGNFVPGTTRDSVIRGLDTGEFLRYQPQISPEGQRLFIDSALHLGAYRCIVDLDEAQIVVRREYQSW